MKILIIDSDEISFIIVKRYFSLSGLQPHWVRAHTGLEAVDYLRTMEMPDLIFLEPRLPDMPPDEIFRHLQNVGAFAKTKVCLLTTFIETELGIWANGYTVFKKFLKPFLKSYVDECNN